MMKSQSQAILGVCVVMAILVPNMVEGQGTAKVQEFFKKYFGEYFPKTTRSYTLYGNGLNGPADYNAGLPVGDETEGPIKSIIIRRGSPGRQNGGPQQPQAMMPENTWQPVPNFDPVAFAKGGHRGRSDLTDELDEAESRIITAEDALAGNGEGIREFKMESSMSFSSPGLVEDDVIMGQDIIPQ